MVNHPCLVQAVDAVTISVTPSREVKEQGETFTAFVAVSQVSNLNKFSFKLTYNPEVLEIIGTEGGSGVSAGTIVNSSVSPAVTYSIPITWSFDPAGTPGTISVVGNLGATTGNGAYGTGSICEIDFEVIGDYGESSDITPLNTTEAPFRMWQQTGSLLTVDEIEYGTIIVQYPPVAVTVNAPETVPAGDVFTVTIDVSLVQNISAYQFDLRYDPEVLRVVGDEGGDGITGGMIGDTEMPLAMWLYTPIGVPGTIRVLGGDEMGGAMTGAGTLVSIQFEAIGDGGESSSLEFVNGYYLFRYAKYIADVTWNEATVDLISSYRITNTSPLPKGEINRPYSNTLAATGGTAPYSFIVASGTLPAGLTMTSGGIISGTPLVTGTFSITFQVTDATPAIATKTLSLTIAGPPDITTTTLPNGATYGSYSQTLAVSGGVSPYTWSKTEGSLPGNVTLSTSGTISGTPSAVGTYTFTVMVTDAMGGTDTQSLTLTINAAPTISTTSPLPRGEKGIAYSTTLSGAGGVGSYTYSLVSGTLPTGLSLSPAGVISGTPSIYGTFTGITIRITDSLGGTGSKIFYVIIADVPTITTTSLTNGEVSAAYSQTLALNGGVSPLTWTLDGGSLPAGLSLSTAGVISGTPTTKSTAYFTVRVTDSLGATDTQYLSLAVIAAVTITTTSPLTNGQVGQSYTSSLSVSGGTASYTWGYSGTLPPGLALSTWGVLSGTPTTSGTYSFTARVTDGLGGVAYKVLSVTIVPAPTISTDATLPTGEKSVYYTLTFSVDGGTSPYTWKKTSGTLPSGLVFSSGRVYGTPSSTGTYSFTIQVTDSVYASSTKTFSLTIVDPVSVGTTSPIPSGEINIAYSYTLTASGGISPYSWSVKAGSIPTNFSLSSDGVLSGTATVTGDSSFQALVTDSLGATAYKTLTITIVAAPTITTSSSLTEGGVGLEYSQTLTVSGGVADYSWSVYSGSLPDGLSLSSGGVISGTPTSIGTSTFGVQVTDSLGGISRKSFTISIVQGLNITTSATLPTGEYNIAYSTYVAVTGGASPYTWYKISGSLPNGLSLGQTSGLISGIPTYPGPYSFTLKVTDSLGLYTTRTFSLNIASTPSVSSAAVLSTGETNIAYSNTLSATGGVSPYTWAITYGSLPTGLSLSSAGVISGIPTSVDTYSFTIRVTDGLGGVSQKAFSLSIVAGPTITTGSTLTNGGVDIAYSQTLAASGGVGTYNWSLSEGTLPGGLTLSSGGVISGTPTTAGSSTFTITLTDSLGGTAGKSFTITIYTGITITSDTTMPTGEYGIAYSQTFTVVGGVSPYTWSKNSGTLPTGVTLNASTGVLSGTPTSPATYTFSISVSDSLGLTNSQSFTLTIAASPNVTTTTLADGEVGIVYSKTLTVSGGLSSYSWTRSSGTLPTGLTLSSTGVLSGTPSAAGTYSFYVRVVDSLGGTDTQNLTLKIFSAPAITTTNLDDGGIALPYNDNLAGTGGTGVYTWSRTAGSLPDGLSLSTTGVISGTPTTAGSSTFTILLTDSMGGTASQSFTIEIYDGLTITTSETLPEGEDNIAYSQTLAVSGGSGSYTFSKTEGTVPTGISLSSTTGKLSGTPTIPGTYIFTIKVTDSYGLWASKEFTLVIAANPTMSISSPLPSAEVSVAYYQALGVNGGVAPFTWTKSSGTIPDGLELSSEGVVSGTPEESGTFYFTIRVVDSLGAYTTKTYKLSVVSALYITTDAALISGEVNLSYSKTLVAAGGQTAYSWALGSGSLPAGLSLSSAGVIGGTPTASGTFTFTVEVTDSLGGFTSRTFSLVIYSAPVITTGATLPSGEIGIAYSLNLAVSGGVSAYTWSKISGTIPAGLTFSAGKLSGTPTYATTYNFEIRVTDSLGGTATRTFSLAIVSGPAVSTSTLPNGEVGAAYAQTLAATSGVAPYTWSKTAGSLPSGLSLSSSGVISGNPTTAVTAAEFTVQVTDSLGGTAAKTLQITVIAGLSISDSVNLPSGVTGIAYNHTLTASGGEAPYTWTLTVGPLPTGLSVNSSGTISGTPSAVGTSIFSITVNDNLGGYFTKEFSLTITVPPSITSSTLTTGEVNVAYSQTLAASGGVSPYIWTLNSGSLPGGLTLSSAGVLSGTPTAAGTYSFGVKVTDNVGAYNTATITVTIAAIPIISISGLPSGEANVAYAQSLTVSGGVSPYVWSIQSGTLPAGMSFSAAGLLSGTPSSATAVEITFKVTDSLNISATRIITLNIAENPVITSGPELTAGGVGIEYEYTLTLTGGVAPYSWTLIGSLPSGLSLSSSGVITGTPVITGTSNFSVRVTDYLGGTDTQTCSLAIVDGPVISTLSVLPTAEVNVNYSQTLAAGGGLAPYTWTLAAGTLPTWLSLTSGGVLSGTPTASTTISFEIRVTDSLGLSAVKSFSLYIAANPIITTAVLLTGEAGLDYLVTLTATGGVKPYTWALESGTLPEGLTLDSSGTISGSPQAAWSGDLTLKLTDSYGVNTTSVAGLTILAAPQIDTAALNAGEVNFAYTQTLSASGGQTPYNWIVQSGDWPDGLNLSSDGVISGTPESTGDFTFTLLVSDNLGGMATRSLNLQIVGAPEITTDANLPDGEVQAAYQQTAGVSGGIAPYNWALLSGDLPSGLGLDANGTLSGTAVVSGTYYFTLNVVDSLGGSDSREFTLIIAEIPEISSESSLPEGEMGVEYSQTLTVAGGVGPFAWTVLSGVIPPGLELSGEGILSGSPTAAGSYVLTVQVTDSLGGADSLEVNLTILAAPVITNPDELPAAEAGAAYSYTLNVDGGTSPYNWSASGLPNGLTIDSDGLISGTPTEFGTYSGISITVIDSFSPAKTIRKTFSLTVYAGLQISTETLESGLAGDEYQQILSVSGGISPFSWQAEDLPEGLNIDADSGIISGTPATAGQYEITVTATDSYNPAVSVSRNYTIKIYAVYDANGNSRVDMGDVVKIQRIYLGLDPATPAADANRDGVVNPADMVVIIRYILNLD